MTLKIIAVSTYVSGAQAIKHHQLQNRQAQRGVTLLELMVGLTIGLLVVAVAMGGLMVSRGVNGTVSDVGGIQQQAAYAMRLIGLQLRQTASLRLNPNSSGATGISEELAPVAFEVKSGQFNLGDVDARKLVLDGKDSPATGEYKLTVGYAGYTEASNVANAVSFRDCLGQGPTNSLLQSRFVLDSASHELRCAGAANSGAQALLNNVADFQVRYLRQTANNTGSPTLQYVSAATASADWAQIQGVEVCLTLFGTESIDMPAGSTYTQCDGTTQDMTTLTDGQRKRRMHLTFRNTFQLRSQGLLGTVIPL